MKQEYPSQSPNFKALQIKHHSNKQKVYFLMQVLVIVIISLKSSFMKGKELVLFRLG